MTTTVAVVGCGYWGKNLVRNFAGLEALKMVCEVAEVSNQVLLIFPVNTQSA